MSIKTVRNIREPLKKPRPLKSTSIEQIEVHEPPKRNFDAKACADLLPELEILHARISDYDLGDIVTDAILQICTILKKHGEGLDATHKDAMDRYFCTLRHASREHGLDVLSRLRLLEIIEMRAMRWKLNENLSNYFNSRCTKLEQEAAERQNLCRSPSALLDTQNQNLTTSAGGISLAPGEFLRSSGKFTRPTKIAGKNYFKDEIVIRNCDSGKVMGIKGRRVHMIEELSDTVISFQRVNAGARDRLVQITGPHEESISHAKFLVEDTIKRNVSPVRDNLSLSETSTLDNDPTNSFFDRNASQKRLMHSFSMSDATSRECSIPLQIGNNTITLSGTNPDILKTAKKVLMDYFSGSLDIVEKNSVLPLTRSASSGNSNQRFPLKKQISLKDNFVGMLSSDEQRRRSSSSTSWSSDEIPETAYTPQDVPIPPPSYSCRHIYSREFLLECANLPLSRKVPSDFQHYTSIIPDIKPQSPIMFDPSYLLQNGCNSH